MTVLKALRAHFPRESYVYVGDTARLPYGTKSPETVVRYSLGLARALIQHNVKAIVVACNTASTHALGDVARLAAGIPVLGMVEPAARAAIAATRGKHIGVIATSGTIASGVYERTIASIDPSIKVSALAAQMLVALAEEGWSSGPIAESVVRKYLDPMFDREDAPDTLILGCTHFPVFGELLRRIVGNGVTLVNSGEAAACSLSNSPLLQKNSENLDGTVRLLATDDPARFAANAEKFFGHPVLPQDVTLVDITP